MKTIVDYIDLQANLYKDKTFLKDHTRSFTFGDFSSQVKKMSHFLKEKKVSPGDRVMLYIDNRINHMISYFAAMSIGAVAVHLYPEKKWDYVEFAAVTTGASLLITDRGEAPPQTGISNVEQFPRLNENSPEYTGNERSEVAYMMFTSGTTAQPKAVMTTHENILFTAQTVIKIANMEHGDREIIFLPLGSTGGLGHMHCCLMLGNFAFLYPRFFFSIDNQDLKKILEIIKSQNINGLLATPVIIQNLLETCREEFIRVGQNLKYLLANVHPMTPELIEEVISLFPKLRFAMYYGLTEASRSAYNIYSESGKYSKTGHAAEGVLLKLQNPDPATGFGEVMIKGPNVAEGYWGKGSFTDQEGWFASGDVGGIDTEGYLTIHGRVNELINVSGMKSIPSEIESVLKGFPGIIEAAVIGLEDSKTYQRICAALVIQKNLDQEKLLQELELYLDEKLEVHKKPAEIILVDQLPKTELGKVQRKKVKELFKADDI